MEATRDHWWFFISIATLALLVSGAKGIDIFLEWDVAISIRLKPATTEQPVITINGMFPGPLINATTNDFVHVNVFNNMDEPLLFTWNGIQQRLNSWQDGVSGTNCPILPGKNWTYVFQTKDQIGSFAYFPTTNYQKAGGGFGPIRVNNRNVILVPFPKPEAEFDLLIGDWFNQSYKERRTLLTNSLPDLILVNGQGNNNDFNGPQSLHVKKGMAYRLRISNVGSVVSLNFRIKAHTMLLVETEGSYTNQIRLDSLDVHVGQSYSVLITADQDESVGSYYMVATPTQVDLNSSLKDSLVGVGLLVYQRSNSVGGRKMLSSTTTPYASDLWPVGPDPMDREFSINQAKSIRWNLTTGAARPNPQGTFNVSNITLTQNFVLHGSKAVMAGVLRYTVNNVSYLTPFTPLKLADHFVNGSGVYRLDTFPTKTINRSPIYGTSVVSGIHKGWIEIVFKNDLDVMDAWHLDGFGFYVVGFGDGEWSPDARSTYNLIDPVVRSTVQVYPGGWSAIYAFLDNPGMWNLRSQILQNWYLGQEIYIRVYNGDPNPAKEKPIPENVLLCGMFASGAPAPQGLL